jgi:hypothetical protein
LSDFSLAKYLRVLLVEKLLFRVAYKVELLQKKESNVGRVYGIVGFFRAHLLAAQVVVQLEQPIDKQQVLVDLGWFSLGFLLLAFMLHVLL